MTDSHDKAPPPPAWDLRHNLHNIRVKGDHPLLLPSTSISIHPLPAICFGCSFHPRLLSKEGSARRRKQHDLTSRMVGSGCRGEVGEGGG